MHASIRLLEMLICKSRFGKNCTVLSHVLLGWKWSMSRHTAHRRIRNICRALRSLSTEGNEKADELTKAGAMLDEEFMAEVRAKTVQQVREEVYAALQHAASLHCLAEE